MKVEGCFSLLGMGSRSKHFLGAIVRANCQIGQVSSKEVRSLTVTTLRREKPAQETNGDLKDKGVLKL